MSGIAVVPDLRRLAMPGDERDVSTEPAAPSLAPGTVPAPGRRDFLRYSGGLAAAGGLAGAVTGAMALTAPGASAATAPSGDATAATTATGSLAATPIRPPAAPLAVRGPYGSTWLPATLAPGTWPQFWQGRTTALAGLVRIDGVSKKFCRNPKRSLWYGVKNTVAGLAGRDDTECVLPS